MDSGPYTGEISASMIKSCGCKLVELAHAERFKYFNETNEVVNKKIFQSLKYNLTPLVCIGEQKKIISISMRKEILFGKIKIFFKKINLRENQKIIFAYEPIWAIGKSKSADVDYVAETADFIREVGLKILKIKKNQLKVIYGGSVNIHNAKKLLNINQLDGIFIGRSAIKAKDFIKICQMVD